MQKEFILSLATEMLDWFSNFVREMEIDVHGKSNIIKNESNKIHQINKKNFARKFYQLMKNNRSIKS